MNSATSPTAATVPWSIRLCDALCLGFAGWTLVAHATVVLGGSLRQLLIAAGVVPALGILAEVAGRRLRGRGWLQAWFASEPAPEKDTAPESREHPIVRYVLAALALVVVATSFTWWRTDFALLWAGGLAVVALAFLHELQFSPGTHAPNASRARELSLWLLALGSAALAGMVHRPDADEPFYLNLAVAAADFPNTPLFRTDLLHGLKEFQPPPYYRTSALELLCGALSYLGGWEPVMISHVAFAMLAGLAIPLVVARATRLLAPEAWLWAVVAVLALLVADGGQHRAFGNFAFVRLYQGKAMFVSFGVPLLVAHGVLFGRAPTLRGLLRLGAAQVCCVGLTSTALWCAPLVACGSVVATLRWRRSDLRILALAVLSAAWALGMALYVRSQLGSGSTHATGTVVASVKHHAPSVAHTVRVVLGGTRPVHATAALLLLGCCLGPTRMARRVACVLGLVFLALLINPKLAGIVSTKITGKATYWRALWALPVPLLAALALVAPIRRRKLAGLAVALAMTVGFTQTAYTRGSVTARGVRLAWPSPKVPPAHRIAEYVVHHVRPHTRVLAPRNVSAWLPTFRRYAYPVLVKEKWLRTKSLQKARAALMRCTQNRPPPACTKASLITQLEKTRIGSIVFRPTRTRGHDLRPVLTSAGFVRRGPVPGTRLEIWTKHIKRRGSRESGRLRERRHRSRRPPAAGVATPHAEPSRRR